MRSWGLLGVVVLLAGCPSGGGAIPTRDAGRRDANVVRDSGSTEDAALEDAAVDDGDAAGIDAALEDAAVDDAATSDDGASDAGSGDGGTTAAPPAIDGVVSDGEWAGATSASNTIATIWTGNELRRIRALLRPEGLYVAVEGVIEGGNGLMVYVDRARGTPDGVALADITDSMDALDDAITPGAVDPITTPADVHVDLGWGSLDLSRSAAGADARMGWRDFVRGTPGDLYWILAGEAPTTCGADACETFLPRAILDLDEGAARPRTVAMFARITNPDGTQSPNQTLPMDAPDAPRTVSALLELSE